jgi:hypothetical protein
MGSFKTGSILRIFNKSSPCDATLKMNHDIVIAYNCLILWTIAHFYEQRLLIHMVFLNMIKCSQKWAVAHGHNYYSDVSKCLRKFYSHQRKQILILFASPNVIVPRWALHFKNTSLYEIGLFVINFACRELHKAQK